MSCDVFIAAIDYLNIPEFIEQFHKIDWEKPKEALLMIKTEGQASFTLYQAKVQAFAKLCLAGLSLIGN